MRTKKSVLEKTNLREFAPGKIDFVTNKLFSILTRTTGIRFKVQKSIFPYSNRWGKFLGKQVFTPDGRTFRLNFLQGKTDEAVSLEYWAKGKNPEKMPPTYVLSFEGWGITKIFSQIEVFVRGDFKSLMAESVLRESVKDVFVAYAEQNPDSIQHIIKNGFDDAEMFATLKAFMAKTGLKTAGLSKGTLAATVKSYLKKVASGQEQSSVPREIAKAAASQVPVAEILPGTNEGKNTVSLNLIDVLDTEAYTEIKKLISEVDAPDGPLGVIKHFEYQLDLLLARNGGARLVIACGRAGTGKTSTLKKYLEEKAGLAEGYGYLMAPAIRFDDEDDVTALFCLNASTPLVVLDDADQLFLSRSVGVQNIMKHVLDPDRPNRELRIPKKITTKMGVVEEGSYTIDCKLVWCTNKGIEVLTPAILDRAMVPVNVFDFSDKDILELIKAGLSNTYNQFPDLPQKDILRIFSIYQSVVDARIAAGDTSPHKDIAIRYFLLACYNLESLVLKNEPQALFWKELVEQFNLVV